MIKKTFVSAFALISLGVGIGFASNKLNAQNDQPFCAEGKCDSDYFFGYAEPSPFGRYTISTTMAERGTSKPLDMKRVEYLCADLDGCEIRMGMHNWDGTQRIASREGMLYYNKRNRAWRTSYDMPMYDSDHDPWGTDGDGSTKHLMQAWSCHLTDGDYENWQDKGDKAKGLNILSWNQYNADCTVTLID